jgi:VWFA-related protein
MRTNPTGQPLGIGSKALWFILIGLIFFFAAWSGTTPSGRAQSPQNPQTETSQEMPKPEGKKPREEIVSSDVPATFKLRVNLVLVRVVVRNVDGKVISNLKKEDFQLTDTRKPQVISSFSVETPVSHLGDAKAGTPETNSVGTPATMPILPQGFVALFFDDLQLSTSDATNSRQAATKVLASLREDNRIAVFTSSGREEQDFTADRAKLDLAIQRISPSLQGSVEDCMPPSVYLANLIVELNDTSALTAAMKACGSENTTRAVAQNILSFGENKVRRGFSSLNAVIQRMGQLPGQRTVVLISPGFFVPYSIHESGEIIDQASKANIVINAIDARGLYTTSYSDASTPPSYANLSVGAPDLAQYIRTEERVQDDVLGELTDGTGGLFFHDRNDMERSLLESATEPNVSYVLGFVPEPLKLDGKYHQLKVAQVNKQKWALQARHGYFAPHGESNPEDAEKQEIEQGVFSQTEMQDFPTQCQTQSFASADGIHLAVLARYEDNLTIVTAVFDDNGNLLEGRKKIIEMNLTDASRARLNKEGLKVKSSFTLPPGSYLVRIVVRDSEGVQMSALNQPVLIQ